jgi:hypothetical protein
MRRGLMLAVSALVLTVAAGAAENAYSLAPGGKRTVAFDRPVETLYLADPAVADVRAIDKQHITLTAKTRGVTSFLALDAQGAAVMKGRVTVGVIVGVRRTAEPADTVTLQRGSEHVTYACGDSGCRATRRSGGKGAEADASSAPTPVAPVP